MYAHMGPGFMFMKFFCLLFCLGVVLFIVWAVRALDKKQLKKLFISLLVIGLLGMAGSGLLLHKGYDCDDDDCGRHMGKWSMGEKTCPLSDDTEDEEMEVEEEV